MKNISKSLFIMLLLSALQISITQASSASDDYKNRYDDYYTNKLDSNTYRDDYDDYTSDDYLEPEEYSRQHNYEEFSQTTGEATSDDSNQNLAETNWPQLELYEPTHIENGQVAYFIMKDNNRYDFDGEVFSGQAKIISTRSPKLSYLRRSSIIITVTSSPDIEIPVEYLYACNGPERIVSKADYQQALDRKTMRKSKHRRK